MFQIPALQALVRGRSVRSSLRLGHARIALRDKSESAKAGALLQEEVRSGNADSGEEQDFSLSFFDHKMESGPSCVLAGLRQNEVGQA